jgi:hypothetical protein
MTKKKSRKRVYKQEKVAEALNYIKNGMSIKTAAVKWQVPRTTLSEKKNGHSKVGCRPGPSTILNHHEEQLLCDWILEMSRRALPLTKLNLLDSIKAIDDDPRPNPFTDNRPGSIWFELFLKRHPEVALKHAVSISRSRGALTEGCIRG